MEEQIATITFSKKELSILHEVLQFSINHTKNYMKENNDWDTKEECEKELLLLNSIMEKRNKEWKRRFNLN